MKTLQGQFMCSLKGVARDGCQNELSRFIRRQCCIVHIVTLYYSHVIQTLHVFVVKLVKFFLSFATGFQSSE